jgi:hypothetical protein
VLKQGKSYCSSTNGQKKSRKNRKHRASLELRKMESIKKRTASNGEKLTT